MLLLESPKTQWYRFLHRTINGKQSHFIKSQIINKWKRIYFVNNEWRLHGNNKKGF